MAGKITRHTLSLEYMVNSQIKPKDKDPVFAKQQFPMFGLNSRDPVKSQSKYEDQKQKTVAKTHDSQKRFQAYEKANEQLRAKSRLSESPTFVLDDSVFPRSQQARLINTSFRTSHYPKSSLTPELERKVSLLTAYKALVASADYGKDKSEPMCKYNVSIPASRVKSMSKGDDFDLILFEKALEQEKRCEICKLEVCRCIKTVPDDYLRKISRRVSRSRAKISISLSKPSKKYSHSSKLKVVSHDSIPRHTQNSYDSQQSPILSPVLIPMYQKANSMRMSVGSESVDERGRNRKEKVGSFRVNEDRRGNSEDPLDGILQVSQANLSQNQRSRKSKVIVAMEDTEDSDDMNQRIDLQDMGLKA